jgi:transposase InsO family protein
LTEAVVSRVLAARRQRRWGPHRLAPALDLPRSTVYAVLRRNGCSRLIDFDPATRQVVRYVRERPGELIHIDIKKLGRIPEGGGHRLLGRERDKITKHLPRRGQDFIYVAVDDCTRLAFVATYPRESAELAGAFLRQANHFFGLNGIQVESVMTDNGLVFSRGRAFRQQLATLGLGHLLTQPYRPRTNGKAERFIQTMLGEWAYDRLYLSNELRLGRLGRWLHFYNSRRHHTALGCSPLQAVNNVRGNYS